MTLTRQSWGLWTPTFSGTHHPFTSAALMDGLLSARRGSVDTTSFSVGYSLSPSRAVDGSTGTEYHSNDNGTGQWIALDFGNDRQVSVSHLALYGWNDNLPRNFKLQGSNDASVWQDLLTVAGDGPSKFSWWDSAVVVSGQWRYVRILQTGANSRGWLYQVIGELEIWGTLHIGAQEYTYDDLLLQDSPAVFLKGNQGSGTTVIDYSGYGRNGIADGGYTWAGVGLFPDAANSLDFAGTNGSINMSQSATTWTYGDQFSAEAIIEPDAIGHMHIGEAESRWSFFINSSGTLSVAIYLLNGTWAVTTGSTTLLADAVYHPAFTVSGASAKLFLNGSEDGSSTMPSTPQTAAISANTAFWATGTYGGASRYNGRISHMALYPSALDESRFAARAARAGLGA